MRISRTSSIVLLIRTAGSGVSSTGMAGLHWEVRANSSSLYSHLVLCVTAGTLASSCAEACMTDLEIAVGDFLNVHEIF